MNLSETVVIALDLTFSSGGFEKGKSAIDGDDDDVFIWKVGVMLNEFLTYRFFLY